jgi:hypothetical protein
VLRLEDRIAGRVAEHDVQRQAVCDQHDGIGVQRAETGDDRSGMVGAQFFLVVGEAGQIAVGVDRGLRQ